MKITGSPEVIAAINRTSHPQKSDRLIQDVIKSLPAKDEVFLHHLVPGRSGAIVCLALTRSFGTFDIPIIIKLGPYALLSTEAGNYDKYVLQKLRTAPRLLPTRPVSNGKMAIAYELAGWTKSPDHVITYHDYFHRTKSSDLLATLIPILKDLESWWGSAEVTANTIFDYYRIYSVQTLTDSLENICQDEVFARFLSADPSSLIDSWNSWKTSWPFNSTLRSILHGDLHSTNIVIDTENNRPALIDFASVRQDGHILMDIARLERDIRCRLTGLEEVDFKQRLIEQETLEAFFSYHLGALETAKAQLSQRRKSEAYHKAFSALINVYIKAADYFSTLYPSYIQFLAEFYVSIFFQTILVTMLPREDYPGQKVAAANSCFRLRNYIQNILSEV